MFLPPKNPQQVHIGLAFPLPEPLYGQVLSLCPHGEQAQRHPHLTLQPPTEITVAALPFVIARLRHVACGFAPFQVSLGQARTFLPISPVAYLPVEAGAGQCAELHRALGFGPWRRSDRFPFVPHVTLAHNFCAGTNAVPGTSGDVPSGQGDGSAGGQKMGADLAAVARNCADFRGQFEARYLTVTRFDEYSHRVLTTVELGQS